VTLLRCIALALICLVVLGTFTASSSAHLKSHKAYYEHTADVYRFFRNHPQVAKLTVAKKILRQHTRHAYRLLIGKWDGVYHCENGSYGWRANTGNGYYGGLQMDRSFQRSYGGEFMRWWGTANNWPAWAQMAAAERAYHSGRGFGPWPYCGRFGG
jgi:hypothetical protein